MKTRFWIDCATCGSQPCSKRLAGTKTVGHMTPFARSVPNYVVEVSQTAPGVLVGYCSKCRKSGPAREIKIRDRGVTDECNGACLNGKHSCNCKCGGRCHGAGTCSCKAA